jgi:hypothetical protein
MFFERSFYYNQAKHKVIVDDKSIEETINDIVVLLTNKRSCYCFPQTTCTCSNKDVDNDIPLNQP